MPAASGCRVWTPRANEVRQARRDLGYLPQGFGFSSRFTAREFVEYVARLKEVRTARIAVAGDRALGRVEMTELAQDRMGPLSGGLARRVGIAQAIVDDPQILMLDEPTAGPGPRDGSPLKPADPAPPSACSSAA